MLAVIPTPLLCPPPKEEEEEEREGKKALLMRGNNVNQGKHEGKERKGVTHFFCSEPKKREGKRGNDTLPDPLLSSFSVGGKT